MNGPVDFSPLVAEYTKYRVGYGDALFGRLANRIGAKVLGTALDVAAGTGLSTYPLLELVDGLVVGADIGAMLLKGARSANDDNRLRYLMADARNLPLADQSVSLVTCAQALHWIPHEEALAEVFRVLSPSGWFFAYWKYPSASEPYQQIADRLIGGMLGKEISQGFSLKRKPNLKAHGFENVVEETIDYRIPFTVERYTGFMRSRRRVRDLTGNRFEEFLERYEAELKSLLKGRETFEELNVIYLFSGQKPDR